MTMSQSDKTEDTIDLKELFFSLIAQWKLIAVCIILSVVCALLYLRTTPHIYSVNALVQVEESKGASAFLSDVSNLTGQKQPAQAEIEILKSRLILGSVIKELHLDILINSDKNSFTDRLFNRNNYATEYQKNNIVFRDNDHSFSIKSFEIPTHYLDKNLNLHIQDDSFKLTDFTGKELYSGKVNQVSNSVDSWQVAIYTTDIINATYSIKKISIPAAVARLNANYSVAEKGRNSGILGLNYLGHDKEHITKVLNAILKAYTLQNVEHRSAEIAQTLDFLNTRLPQLEQELDDAEREFNQFRQIHNTVDITKESDLYLTQSMNLETRKADLEQRLAELAAKFTNEHPAIQEVTKQLDSVNSKIEGLNHTLKLLPDIQRQYLQLYRKVEVKQALYTTLLNSSQQLTIAKAGEIGNVRIVDHAVLPLGPISPNKLPILGISLIIGALVGLLLAVIRSLLLSGIKDSTQIENELDLPVYATVPRSNIQESHFKLLKRKKFLPILAIKNSNDLEIESLRSMRTAIHFALSHAKNNMIMVTGPGPEVGKSFISVNLATILAQSGKRVLLIDADMRRGYMHQYFKNANNQYGLATFLNGQSTIEQIIQKSEVVNLDFIARGKSPSNPSELLSTETFAKFIEEVSQRYDHIIIDTPPVLAVTDSVIISQFSGVNLVVARYAKSQMKELELVVNRFDQVGVKVNGLILNDVQREVGSPYGYGYNYAYTSKKD